MLSQPWSSHSSDCQATFDISEPSVPLGLSSPKRSDQIGGPQNNTRSFSTELANERDLKWLHFFPFVLILSLITRWIHEWSGEIWGTYQSNRATRHCWNLRIRIHWQKWCCWRWWDLFHWCSPQASSSFSVEPFPFATDSGCFLSKWEKRGQK